MFSNFVYNVEKSKVKFGSMLIYEVSKQNAFKFY